MSAPVTVMAVGTDVHADPGTGGFGAKCRSACRPVSVPYNTVGPIEPGSGRNPPFPPGGGPGQPVRG